MPEGNPMKSAIVASILSILFTSTSSQANNKLVWITNVKPYNHETCMSSLEVSKGKFFSIDVGLSGVSFILSVNENYDSLSHRGYIQLDNFYSLPVTSSVQNKTHIVVHNISTDILPEISKASKLRFLKHSIELGDTKTMLSSLNKCMDLLKNEPNAWGG